LKIFLDASPEVRAERRWKEHQEKGERITVAEVFDEVIERDKRDRERKVSPLVRASDAVLVDNTAMGIEETARLIVLLAHERQNEATASAGTKVSRARIPFLPGITRPAKKQPPDTWEVALSARKDKRENVERLRRDGQLG